MKTTDKQSAVVKNVILLLYAIHFKFRLVYVWTETIQLTILSQFKQYHHNGDEHALELKYYNYLRTTKMSRQHDKSKTLKIRNGNWQVQLFYSNTFIWQQHTYVHTVWTATSPSHVIHRNKFKNFLSLRTAVDAFICFIL